MRRAFAVLALLSACAAPRSTPTSTGSSATPATRAAGDKELRYSVIVLGRLAGGASTVVHADGRRETDFAYTDNGRGPKIHARVKLSARGVMTSFDATGTETMGAVVDEHLAFDGDGDGDGDGARARWSSRAERGEKETSSAFYIPLASYPETLGLLVRALLASGGRVPLLPDGEARLERTSETTVTGSSGPRHLTSYAITGLDVLPTRVWMDDDGELFGQVDAWWSFVRAGYEGTVDGLVALQKELEEKREEDLAKQLARRPDALAFTHVRVFDADAKRWLTDQTVVVQAGKVASVRASATTKPPRTAEIIDGTGKSLLPGLWDMHAHLGPGDGELDIASGVTTARDLGNDPDTLDRMKARFDAGRALGPKVVRAGFIEGRGEKAAGSKVTAETEAEAVAAVAEFARRGYDQIKIYNSMKPELVPILAREAHAKGMRVSGHVPVHMRAEDVVRAGYDEIQHVNMLFLNFFVTKETDTRTTLRFSLVAENAPSLDLSSPRVKELVKLLVQKKTVIDPTLAVFEHMFTAREGEPSPGMKPVLHRLPVQVRRGALTGGLVVPEGKDGLYRQSYARAKELVKLLHTSGVPLVAGTDARAGLMLHRELETYVDAGLPVDDVLYIATLGAAKVTRRDKTTGSIKPGKEADLVLVAGDPHAHIEDIRNVVLTVRSGVVVPSRELYEAVGIGP